MGATFGAYGVAYSGMNVNKTNLNTTSHNLANANTPGYTRQRAVGEELMVNTQYGKNNPGSGTAVQELRRIRNSFLDQVYRTQNSKANYWETKKDTLNNAAITLNEFQKDDGETLAGVQQCVKDFFQSWNTLGKNTGDLGNRNAVLQAADALVKNLSAVDQKLGKMQYEAAGKAADSVKTLNDLAAKVAALNQQISNDEDLGGEASDLRDQRDSYVDQMSNLANVSVNLQAGKTFQIFVGSVALVNGNETQFMKASGDGSQDNPFTLEWEGLSCAVKLDGGSIKAYMEDAKQSGLKDFAVAAIPCGFSPTVTAMDLSGSSPADLRKGLNTLVSTIAFQVNLLHATGKGIDSDHYTGLDFFVPINEDKPLGISNMKVNPALSADPNKLAAASDSGLASDNHIAKAIYALEGDSKIFQYEGLTMNSSNFYKSIVHWIGAAGDTANGNYTTEFNKCLQADSQRAKISSVSIDEEMSEMMIFQNAYSASARVLSTLDSMVADMIKEIG